jgi:hypothetical protein
MTGAAVPMWVLTAGALILAGCAAQTRPAGWVRRLTHRPGLLLGVVGLLGFGIAATTALYRPDAPRFQDEFAYTVAAETFAAGRLTNPTPAGWEHFETHHTLLWPSYQAKYPPMQGLLLALGVLLAQEPFVGAWIGAGLVAVATAWMLGGWLPPRWALVGGLLAATHPFLHHAGSYSWSQTLWGGSTAAIGTCLVYGGWFRLQRRRQARYGWAIAAGLVILANSRPFEGLLVSLPPAWAFLRWWGGLPGGGVRGRMIVPLLVGLALGAGLTLNYWWAVTGSPTRMPYLVYEEQYDPIPLFLWGQVREPQAPERHVGYRDFARNVQGQAYFDQTASWAGFSDLAGRKLRVGWLFYWEPFWAGVLGAVVYAGRGSWQWWSSAALVTLGTLVTTWFYPHYAAPLLPVVLALTVQGVRGANRRRWPALLVVLGFVLMVTLRQVGEEAELAPLPWNVQRAQVVRDLQVLPGQHLVFVEYGPQPNYIFDWVYNPADFATAPVLFARSRGAERDARLRELYPQRRAWRVQAQGTAANGQLAAISD